MALADRKNQTFLLLFFIIFLPCQLNSQSANVKISQSLLIKPIAQRLWIHTSTKNHPQWGTVPANGLALVTDNQLILIDTPWNSSQTADLVNWFKRNHHIREVSVIVCHYHQDNLGGLEWISEKGYKSYSIESTREICQEAGLPVPGYSVPLKHRFNFAQSPVEIFFPGPGHTADSIAVYLPEEKVLFGGCSVKALSNRTPGNTGDADLANWPESLRNLKREFPDAGIVVPGHGPEGDMELIDHTIDILSKKRGI